MAAILFSEIAENQYQQANGTLYPHKSLLMIILTQPKIGCVGHFVNQKLTKINISQAYGTLYPHTKFGDDIFITFPLINLTSSKCQ